MRSSIRSEHGSQTVRAEDLTLTCSLSRYERRPLICSGLFRFCHSSALYSVDRSPGWSRIVLPKDRVDTDLIRDARTALECWYATRSGPLDPQYDGIDPERLKNIGDRTLEDFFKRYFVAVASSLFGDT